MTLFCGLGRIADAVTEAVKPIDTYIEGRLVLFLEYEKWYN